MEGLTTRHRGGTPWKLKARRPEAFLHKHPRATWHFALTCRSWQNHLELWFSGVYRAVLTRRILTSTTDFAQDLHRYIDVYGEPAKPFRGKCANPARLSTHGGPSSTDIPLADTLTPSPVSARACLCHVDVQWQSPAFVVAGL